MSFPTRPLWGSPKAEIRRPNSWRRATIRNPKSEIVDGNRSTGRGRTFPGKITFTFGLRISEFFRASAFGFRIFLTALLVLLLTACHPAPPADVVIINGNEPETLDPAVVTAVPDMRIAKALFEGLARLSGKTGRPEPGLAERWEISPDGKTYNFYLRTNAAWSTGEPITSADVLYSW